jgi:protein TonB
MKRLIIFILTIIPMFLYAQNDSSTVIPDVIYDAYLSINNISEPPVINEKEILSDLFYPSVALREGIEGRVILELYIDENGIIQHIICLQENPEGFGFKEAAIKAFEGKTVIPAILNGKKVKCRYRFPVSFRLK